MNSSYVCTKEVRKDEKPANDVRSLTGICKHHMSKILHSWENQNQIMNHVDGR